MIPDERTAPSLPAQYGQLVSVSLPITGVNIHEFLRHALGQPRFYWESSRDKVAFAGFGTALEIMAWGQDRFHTVQERTQQLFEGAHLYTDEPLAAPRLFGGFAFRDDFLPDNTWADFTPAHFVLPHYQMVQFGENAYLTINAHIPEGESTTGVLDDLHEALHARIAWLQYTPDLPHPQANRVTSHEYPMSFNQWERAIMDATGRMKRGELKKIVLSRVAELRFIDRVNVDHALDYLAQAYPETYRFLFEPRAYHAFYGATPEILAHLEGQTVKTMALAGSIKRGANPQDDEALAQQLLNDPKEGYEHRLVIENIVARLKPLARELRVTPTSIMKLSNIQHLYTPIEADLLSQEGVVPLLAHMHPTPALGGEPRDLALEAIGEYEPVTRGWFGAPIGWIDANQNGQFGVAIRSAVAQDRRVWLYAGAGIVAGSVPQKEWDETALKFKPMLNALGIVQ